MSPHLAAELVRIGVDVYVVEGVSEARLLQQMAPTIPIVTLRAGDLVEAGLAANLAKPGGNVAEVHTLEPTADWQALVAAEGGHPAPFPIGHSLRRFYLRSRPS